REQRAGLRVDGEETLISLRRRRGDVEETMSARVERVDTGCRRRGRREARADRRDRARGRIDDHHLPSAVTGVAQAEQRAAGEGGHGEKKGGEKQKWSHERER